MEEIAMGSIKDIYDIIKDVREFAKEKKNNEMVEKLLDIQARVSEIQEELENTKAENRELRNKVQQLEDASVIEQDLELREDGCYVRKSEQRQHKKIRYCAACWQNYKKLMPVIPGMSSICQCENCHITIR